MRERGSAKIIVIVLILFVAIGAGGYSLFFNERAQIDRSIKPDTSVGVVSKRDEKNPRTEIVESGYNVKVTVSPSTNNIISETVDLVATDVSDQTAGVGFFITEDEQGFMKEGMPNIGIDQTASDGWKTMFDTTEYENGYYYINVIVYPEGGEGDPLGIAQIPVEINN